MKKFALSLVVLLAACTEQVHVQVNCEIKEGPTVECAVHEDKGKGEIEVCWDFSATCANGATLKAEHTCQKVKDGATVTATTPKEKVTVSGNCEGAPTAKVENLTINGKSGT